MFFFFREPSWLLAFGEQYTEAALLYALYQHQCELIRRAGHSCTINGLTAAVDRCSEFLTCVFRALHPQAIQPLVAAGAGSEHTAAERGAQTR